MENKRPRLDDPNEYKIIKEMYFKDDRPLGEDLDSIEKLSRMEAKQRSNAKSNR